MRQVALFLIVGGFAAAVNVGARIAYSWFLPLTAAVVLAYLSGMVVAFFLNRWLVFENADDRTGTRAARFVVVNALAVSQTLAITLAGVWVLRRIGGVGEPETVAHLVGVAVPVLTSYFLHKRWTFVARRRDLPIPRVSGDRS